MTWFSVVFLCLGVVLPCSGCSLLEATGEAVGVIGKVVWAGTKAVGSVAYTGTSMAGQAANQANKTFVRPSRHRDDGVTVSGQRTVVPLQKEGKSYYVRVKIDQKIWGRFLLDTGASALQISKSMFRKLNLGRKDSVAIPVTLAGGAVVAGRMVTLDEVKLGEISARHVKSIVLDYEKGQSADGLLGMSFLENFVFQIDTERQQLILERR